MKHMTRLIAGICLMVLCLGMLVSCGSELDPADAQAALDAAGYKHTYSLGKDHDFDTDEQITGARNIIGRAGGSQYEGDKIVNSVIIFYFKNERDAKAAYSSLGLESNRAKGAYDGRKVDWVFKWEGAVVYYGTAEAVAVVADALTEPAE